jgi:hypothetical protein
MTGHALCSWRACDELVRYDGREGRYDPNHEITEYRYAVSDRIFEELIKRNHEGFAQIGYDTTRRKVLEAIAAMKTRRIIPPKENTSIGVSTIIERPHKCTFLNQVICGDCIPLIKQLDDKSIGAVVTSPPYAEQRQGHYQGVPENKYAEWFCGLMTAVRPKLIDDGSVLVVIRAHESDGRVSPYVIQTRLEVQSTGWFEPQELIWLKPDGPPLGSVNRLRRTWEQILWFAKNEPYVNLTAQGRKTEKKGFQDSDPHSLYNTSLTLEAGVSRGMDHFSAGVNEVDRGVDHPAIYPPTLVRYLMKRSHGPVRSFLHQTRHGPFLPGRGQVKPTQ